MKRFNINGQPVLLFEDRLWTPLEPEPTIHGEEERPAEKHRGRPKGSKSIQKGDSMIATERKILKYDGQHKRRHLERDVEDKIIADIRDNDLGMGETCKKYDISVSTYYRLKELGKSSQVREE